MLVGLDVKNPTVMVTWPVFLDLYCIFEAGRIDKTTLIKFWLRFFDPVSCGSCPEQEYLQLLEEIVRGNSLDKPTKSTKMFARMFQKEMMDHGCLGANKEIINDRLAQAFEEGKINIQLLCSALGRNEIDPSFMDIKVR